MLEDKDFWFSVLHFKEKEFACGCGCGYDHVSHELVKLLDRARSIAGISFNISSACRCKKHNKSAGGSPTSSHLKGLAVDIIVNDSASRFKILRALSLVGFNRLGVYKNFIHCDVDNDKRQYVIWYK